MERGIALCRLDKEKIDLIYTLYSCYKLKMADAFESSKASADIFYCKTAKGGVSDCLLPSAKK